MSRRLTTLPGQTLALTELRPEVHRHGRRRAELSGEGELGIHRRLIEPQSLCLEVDLHGYLGQFCALGVPVRPHVRLGASAFAGLSDGKFIGVLLRAQLGELLAIVGDGVGQQVTGKARRKRARWRRWQRLGESNYQPKDRARGCETSTEATVMVAGGVGPGRNWQLSRFGSCDQSSGSGLIQA